MVAISLPLLLAACSHDSTPVAGTAASGRLAPLAVPTSGQTYAVLTTCSTSEKGLDVVNASTQDGGAVALWDYNWGDNQQWTLQATDSGYFKILAKHSGLALEVDDARTANESPVQQWTYVGAPQQQWKFEDVGNGTYEVSPRHAPGMRLDIRGGQLSNGTQIQIYSDNNTCAQRWTLKLTTAAPDTTAPVISAATPVVTDADATVTGRATDNVGVSSATYSLSGPVTASGTLTLAADGSFRLPLANLKAWNNSYTLTLKVSDAAGNTSSSTTTFAITTVNAKVYGAKGDGVTDDTNALRNAASEASKNTWNFFFPSGTYQVRGPISLNGLNGRTVYGSGATLRAFDDFVSGANVGILGMLTVSNSSPITVRDLTIIGKPNFDIDPFTDSARADGLRVQNSTTVNIQGINVQRAHTTGIDVDDSQDVVIQNSSTTEVYGTSIGTHASKNVRILNNTVTGYGDPSRFKFSPGIGIHGHGGDTFLAEGNTIKNISNTATKTEGINNVTYRGNAIDTFGKDGIKIMPMPKETTYVTNAVVENNTVSYRKVWAVDGTSYILFHSVIGGRISNNTVNGSGGNFTRVVTEGNVTKTVPVDEDGVRLNVLEAGDLRTSSITVQNNTIRNVRQGFLVAADTISITGNKAQATNRAATFNGVGITLADNPELSSGDIHAIYYEPNAKGDVLRNAIIGVVVDPNRLNVGVLANKEGNTGEIRSNTFTNFQRPIEVCPPGTTPGCAMTVAN